MDEQATQELAQQIAKNPTKIKKLVMEGFKSFGKFTELLFGDDFNVVLGPNGSGKSNILDALCFVLGKSSSKKLRAEKSANLIYNGGKTKQPGKTAEVSIVFDNSQKTFPIEGDEVKVSRIVRKDGASRYKINGKTKTRGEVIELLGTAKINPDGYNIILQGDIVRLVEMSPIERRQIIEEIAGIGVYEEKKQQALNELGKVENRLNEAEIILKERSTHLRELKKDRDQALKYKELNDQIKTNKASYLRRKLDNKNNELKKLEGKSGGRKERLAKLQAQIQKLRTEIDENKGTVKNINSEIERKGEVEQIKIQKEVEQLRIDIATHKTRISSCNTELERISQRKGQLEKNFEEVEGKTSELTERKGVITAQLDAMQKTIGELDSKIGAFKNKHNLSDHADIDTQFEKLDTQAEEQLKDLQTLREQQQELLREKDKTEFQISTIDEKIAKVKELEDAHKEEVGELKKKKAEFKKLVLELNTLLNQDSKDANTLAKCRTDLQLAQEEEQKLSLRQSAVKESIGANMAVKKVLENRQKLGDIYGTVAELGSSDGKYSMALEIAASHRIHSVVVGDDKTAANAISYLKRQKLGTASFLPLNKIKPVTISEDLKKLAKQKGVHGFALDLLDYDTKFKNVFSHVFGRTLVVDNIATARSIGVGKARMVTLDGDLCETSGAMSGGYRHKKAGSFKEKELGKKLELAQKRITSTLNIIHKLGVSRTENEEKITRYRELKANLEGDIIKQEKILHLDTGDLDATKNYKEELKNNLKHLDTQLTEMDDKAMEETKVLTELKIQKQKLRDQITQLRNPRVLAELNAFEEKKKQLEQESIRLDSEHKNIGVQMNDILGRDAENIQKLLQDMTKETEIFGDEIKNLTTLVKNKESDLAKTEKEQSQFFSQYKGLFEKRNKLGDEITARETKILGVEENARKEELSLNAFSIEEARIKAELAGMAAEFEQYSGVELNMKKPEEQLKKEINDFERIMVRIGNVNMRALEIYETVEKEYQGLMEKKQILLDEKGDVMMLMEAIEGNKKELFMGTFSVVNEQFRRIFSQLTTKGDANLVMENKEDPFDGGLRINVKITGSKFLDIRSLSGGEKTMTALAFLFAIQEHEPASFYILDEVDAALDKANSEKLANLIRSYCTKAQYLVISHNDAIIAEGDILHGVTMNTESGLSKIVSLRA